MSNEKSQSKVDTNSVFMNLDGKASNKPTPRSIFGESRVSSNGVDLIREYSIFNEKPQPSEKFMSGLKEIFDN